jgi:hypothetical protein
MSLAVRPGMFMRAVRCRNLLPTSLALLGLACTRTAASPAVVPDAGPGAGDTGDAGPDLAEGKDVVAQVAEVAGPGDGSKPDGTAQLSLEPADGTTGFGAGTLRVRLTDGALADRVVAALRLRTAPEGAAIAFEAKIASDATGASIQVVPSAPLANRWYLFDLSALPAGTQWAPGASGFVAPDGAGGARFRVGSQPTIRMVELCDKAGDQQKLTVRFSEPVRAPADGSGIVGLGWVGDEKTPVPCTLLPGPTPLHELEYSCQRLDGAFTQKLRVGGYLSSAEGAAQMGAAEVVVDLGHLTPIETGCSAAWAPVEVPGSGTCVPGATANDCAVCGPFTGSACTTACPKVDCSVYPPPLECEPLCASPTCCDCNRGFGEYRWLAGNIRGCGTVCRGDKDRWQSLLASKPALTACTTDTDCALVAYPSGGGAPSVSSGCGRAVNAGAYAGSEAAQVEQHYIQVCGGERIFDCAPGRPTCSGGRCGLTPYPLPDGGRGP